MLDSLVPAVFQGFYIPFQVCCLLIPLPRAITNQLTISAWQILRPLDIVQCRMFYAQGGYNMSWQLILSKTMPKSMCERVFPSKRNLNSWSLFNTSFSATQYTCYSAAELSPSFYKHKPLSSRLTLLCLINGTLFRIKSTTATDTQVVGTKILNIFLWIKLWDCSRYWQSTCFEGHGRNLVAPDHDLKELHRFKERSQNNGSAKFAECSNQVCILSDKFLTLCQLCCIKLWERKKRVCRKI